AEPVEKAPVAAVEKKAEAAEKGARIDLLLSERQRILEEAAEERRDSVGGDFATVGRRAEIQAEITAIDRDLGHQGHDAKALPSVAKFLQADKKAEGAEEAESRKQRIRGSEAPTYGSSNKVFTQEGYERDKKIVRGTTGAGMAAGAEGGGYGAVGSSPGAVSPRQARIHARGRIEAVESGPPSPNVFQRAVDDALSIAAPARRPAAKQAARLIRKRLGELAREADIAERQLHRAWYTFEMQSDEANLDFIDKVEAGEAHEDPKFQAIAETMRSMLDGRREAVRALGKGRLEHCFENYFPHIWKQPDTAAPIIAKFLGRRPIAGPKSFLKKRSLMTVKEGVGLGLEPISNNPVDFVILKAHEMDRYLMAHRLIPDLKERGLIRFVYARARAPLGYSSIDDSAFQVYLPPDAGIPTKEAYDQILVDNLMAFGQSLGIDAKRYMKLGGTKWGVAQGAKVATKFAGPESVLAHEIGHVLGTRYGLFEWMTHPPGKTFKTGEKAGQEVQADARRKRVQMQQELRALADARWEGLEPPESFKKYVRRGTEKEAVMAEALIHAPDKFKKVAPAAYERLVEFLNSHAELRPLLDIKPSLVLGAGEGTVKIPGVTQLGSYFAPEPVAKLLNNHLSPGLRGNRNMIVRGLFSGLRHLGNTLIQAELSLSAFHGFNTTFDVMGTQLGLGLRELFTKNQRLLGLADIATVPTAPVTNLWRGHKLMKAYRQQLETIEDPRLRQMVRAVVGAGGRGRMDPLYHERAIRALVRSVHDVVHGKALKKVSGAVRLPFNTLRAGLEVVSKPLMEWLVPHQKMGAFYMLAEHEMQRLQDGQIDDEQFHERLAQSWDNVDNRMGQLVYDNLFWSRALRDSLFLGIRSVGWNLGSFREFGGGAADIFTTGRRVREGDVALSQKTAYTIGVAIVYGITGAVITYLLTGEPPEEPEDYFFPKTGKKNPDGTAERLVLPIYAKDWWAWAKKPVDTAKNKLNPTLHAIADAWMNKDFFGTEIRHKDDPWIAQLVDTAEYFAGRFLPFAAQNYQRMRREGSGRWRAAGLSVSGIRKAPQYITLTPAKQLALEYLIARLPQGARTKEDFEKAKARKDIKRKYRAGALSKAQAQKQAKGIGLAPAAINRLMRDLAHTQWQETFRRLSFAEAVNVYQLASDEERAKVRSILREKYNRAKPDTPTYQGAKELYQQFMSLEPQNYSEVVAAYIELYEGRAEAALDGRAWDDAKELATEET
ncbi:MAG TPA: hypothetical protein VNA25_30605, partial [Phycisphaerae bacterium]|nr:hypothetical protein [Phycisphaerae bacterium]